MLISLLDCVKNNEMKFIRVVERNKKKEKKRKHQFKQYIFVVQTLILVERENKKRSSGKTNSIIV